MLLFIFLTLGFALTSFYMIYRQVMGKVIHDAKSVLLHTAFYSIILSLMLSLGWITSNALAPSVPFNPIWISVVLFFILGLKMYKNALKSRTSNVIFDTGNVRVLLMFSLLNAFDAFIAGVATGFVGDYAYIHLIIFLITNAIFILLAKLMASRSTATVSVWILAFFGAILLWGCAIVEVIGFFLQGMW